MDFGTPPLWYWLQCGKNRLFSLSSESDSSFANSGSSSSAAANGDTGKSSKDDDFSRDNRTLMEIDCRWRLFWMYDGLSGGLLVLLPDSCLTNVGTPRLDMDKDRLLHCWSRVGSTSGPSSWKLWVSIDSWLRYERNERSGEAHSGVARWVVEVGEHGEERPLSEAVVDCA